MNWTRFRINLLNFSKRRSSLPVTTAHSSNTSILNRLDRETEKLKALSLFLLFIYFNDWWTQSRICIEFSTLCFLSTSELIETPNNGIDSYHILYSYVVCVLLSAYKVFWVLHWLGLLFIRFYPFIFILFGYRTEIRFCPSLFSSQMHSLFVQSFACARRLNTKAHL